MPSSRLHRVSTGDSDVQWTETSDRQGPRTKWHQSRNGPTEQSSLDKNVWTVWIAVTSYTPCWDCLNFTYLTQRDAVVVQFCFLSYLFHSLLAETGYPYPVPKFITRFQIWVITTRFCAIAIQNRAYHKFLPESAAVRQFQTIFYFSSAPLTSQKFDARSPVALMLGIDKLWAVVNISLHFRFTYSLTY